MQQCPRSTPWNKATATLGPTHPAAPGVQQGKEGPAVRRHVADQYALDQGDCHTWEPHTLLLQVSNREEKVLLCDGWRQKAGRAVSPTLYQ